MSNPTPKPQLATNYIIKLTNHTTQAYTFTIKFPNLPSPTPLLPQPGFCFLLRYSLEPSKSIEWGGGIASDKAHLFLITATPIRVKHGEGEGEVVVMDQDILVDFWKDTGGLRGDYVSVNLLPGTKDSNVAWEKGFSWQSWRGAKQLAPGEVQVGSGEGGKMLYCDK